MKKNSLFLLSCSILILAAAISIDFQIAPILSVILICLMAVVIVATYLEIIPRSNTTKLKLDSTRFQAAFDYATIGMAIISKTGKILRINTALRELLGYSEKELLNMNFVEISHPDDISEYSNQLQQLLSGELTNFQLEKRFLTKNADIRWTLVSASIAPDIDGKNSYCILQIQSIDEQRKATSELNHMAYHDPLTNLDNRSQFDKNINLAISAADATKTRFAVIMLDLDRFKIINDSMGHDAGDSLLKIVAERLQTSVRRSDKTARLGGDEFVVIIQDLTHSEIVANISQKILENILKPLVIKGNQVYITTSIGISIYPDDGHNGQTLIESADVALYRAKELGRNNYQFCSFEISAKAKDKLAKETALHQALINNELRIYYQPKVNLKTGQISGLEALLRWQSKKYGDISPQEIIPLAERTGLIYSLSEWIFRTVLKQLKFWHQNGYPELTVSINLSAREFVQPDIAANMTALLKENNYLPNTLEFEITESLIMQDPENNLRVIRALKDMGIKITIDDFGSGYSSLNYLRYFAIDRIKIDLDFIRKMTNDNNSASIVKAMIAMAHELEIKVVGVGVETEDQCRFLVENNCDELQGYFLSPPLTTTATTELMEKQLQPILNIIQHR